MTQIAQKLTSHLATGTAAVQRSRDPYKISDMDDDQITAILEAKGLTKEALEGAWCYFLDDDGYTLVAEFPKALKRSRVPGQPSSVELGDSSMFDGQKAIIAKW